MDLTFSPQQEALAKTVRAACAPFDDDYWLEHDASAEFPFDFHRAMADCGVLGIAMPEALRRHRPRRHRGGAGDARGGALVGRPERGRRRSTSTSSGRTRWSCSAPRSSAASGCRRSSAASRRPASASPSPTPGSTPRRSRRAPSATATTIASTARRSGPPPRRRPTRSSCSPAPRRKEECRKRTDGLTLFYTDLDRRHVDVRVIPKMGRAAVDSNEVFIDGLPVPAEPPHRRRGPRLRVPAPQPQPRAHPGRRRGGRPRPQRARPRRQVRARAHRVRPARSARTSRSSTRSPRAGCSSRPPS